VLAKFKASLTARVRSRLSYVPDSPAVHVRNSSLILLRSLRGEASAALPDLLELLRRRQLEDEYAGSSQFMAETVIAAVSESDPSLVIEAAKHEHRSVRVACCRALGYMKHSASTAGPALTDMLSDPDLMVVMEAARGLWKLDWLTREGLKRLTLRAEQESDSGDRRHFATVIENFRARLDQQGTGARRYVAGARGAGEAETPPAHGGPALPLRREGVLPEALVRGHHLGWGARPKSDSCVSSAPSM